MRSIRGAVAALCAALTVGLTGCATPAAAPAPGPAPVTAADTRPTSPLQFSGETVDGGRFDAATLAGTPVVLWFWAPF